jgi:hypothetical protein
VLILSQHVEQLYARELLADGNGGLGYQLKDRVLDADQFMDTVRRVADGGTTIFAKLDLIADDDINRRVRAVLTYLDATTPSD